MHEHPSVSYRSEDPSASLAEPRPQLAGRPRAGHRTQVHNFLGLPAVISSEPMRRLLEFGQRVARANAAILITGESGTGKELIARAIHHYSMRCSRAWVDLNCAALPELLLESELF